MAETMFSVLFEKLASSALNKLIRHMGIDSEIKKWKRSLLQIQDVLIDASQKEITNQSVKRWLNDLQHLAYDIDDILDDLATEAMHRELTDEPEAQTSKVRKIISASFTSFPLRTKIMKDKLDNITSKLEDLVKGKKYLGLIVKDERQQNKNRRLQTSMIHEPSIVGRQGEKEALVRKLLEDEPCDQNFSVVPIVGMGGVGKTTLAKLLYNEKQVKDHFEFKAWVCISDDFDSFGISKVIFQSVGGQHKEFADLNLLQVALRDRLREKRFLLVLDDVWSESYHDWETLVGPFHSCAPGSKVIMTTRKEQLVKKVCYGSLNHLQSLSHDQALFLFAQHALGVNNFDSHSELKPHGEGIVKKCGGLPLALIALGRLLRTKKDEEKYWKEVLNSEIWRLQDGGEILPALRLSYHDLSAHLKQVFAYCSFIPKDYVFNKDELVLLWMAEGFLLKSYPKSTRERLGHEYFDELLSRSFFQHAPNNKLLFVMHDLMNDLATSVAGDFFVRLDNDLKNNINKEMLEKYRHLSFVSKAYEPYKRFEAFKRAKSLRTFLAVREKEEWKRFYLSNKILVDLLRELPLLRVLSLSGYEIREVPESIGGLKHLRYLNLAQTKITQIPENVCNLYNLQTLILFGCHYLIKLPKSFIKLKNLRHFDIRDTPCLNKIPLGIGELKSLQTLSKIIIGGENKFEITELKDLKNLCGKILIKGLDKVQNAIHAREVNFLQKSFSELSVEWSDLFDGSRKETLEKEVLNELKPCNDNLKQLEIVSYGGIEFPIWVGDPSFLQLKHVSIRGCKTCSSLPPLGQLPSLKELFIEGLDGVKVVGLELLGTGLSFPSLETLSFKDMHGWEKWSTNSGFVFPCLKKLFVEECRNLAVISLEALPSLRVLKINACGNGVLRSLIDASPSITELKIESISGLIDEVWRSVIEYLGGVEELSITKCNEIRYLWESEAKASMVLRNLRKLKVLFCDKLKSLGEEEDNGGSNLMMTSLRKLVIKSCRSIELCSCPNSIEAFWISDCDSIIAISFPKGGEQKLKSIRIVRCNRILEKEFGSSSFLINNTSTTMLEDIWIENLVNLKSIVELNCCVHLTRLIIHSCESLESFPDHHLSHLTSLQHLVITECPSMDASFPSSGVWPPKLQYLRIGGLKKPISEWGPQNFPTSLIHLTLYFGESKEKDVNDFSKLSHLFPSSLTYFRIWGFDKLESLSMGLQHLTSLQYLVIWECPNVMDLPETLLTSLLGLNIVGCSKLKERCDERGSYYWPRISHIPRIHISNDEYKYEGLLPLRDSK